MKAALLCPGLGRSNRGYERFASELFDELAARTDIELFSSRNGVSPGETGIRSLGRDGVAARSLGALSHDRYYWEAVSFGLLAWPKVRGFDLLHYSEPPLNLAFTRFERFRPGRARRLFSHALNMDAVHTLRCHHIHQTSPDSFDAAERIGVAVDRMTLLPYGVRTDQFVPDDRHDARAEARRELGLPADSTVLLSVAAVNRTHKRTDVLVDAVSRLSDKPHLVLCGSLDEPDILEEARRRLGETGVTHLYVEPSQVKRLYAAADFFVLASLVEGFGLAAVEAQLCGLPAIVHDSPHFRWLLGDGSAAFADMSSPQSIAAAIREACEGIPARRSETSTRRARLASRYEWRGLAESYLDMYDRAARSSAGLIEDSVEH